MNKYKSIVLSAESHTDSRGSASYNLSLSERRAMTTAQYVISKGIDASRITGECKGETMPSVDCGGRRRALGERRERAAARPGHTAAWGS